MNEYDTIGRSTYFRDFSPSIRESKVTVLARFHVCGASAEVRMYSAAWWLRV
jgi:hypothetical protein